MTVCERRPGNPAARFMLRVAGLPVEAVHALRCPTACRWAERGAGRGGAAPRTRRRAVSDLLHDLVTTTGTAVRGAGDASPRAAALRRQIFNNQAARRPGCRGGAGRHARRRRPAGRLADWLAARQQLEELLGRGRGAARRRPRTKPRRAARACWRRSGCGSGCCWPRPRWTASWTAICATPRRACARTSGRARSSGRCCPTSTARPARPARSAPSPVWRSATLHRRDTTGRTANSGGARPGPATRHRAGARWTSHARLNVVVLGRLAEPSSPTRPAAATCRSRLASGWGRDEDRVRYVRRWVTAGRRRRRRHLRRGQGPAVLPAPQRRPGPAAGAVRRASRAALRRAGRLARRRARRGRPSECERYLAALLELGMLQVPCLRHRRAQPRPAALLPGRAARARPALGRRARRPARRRRRRDRPASRPPTCAAGAVLLRRAAGASCTRVQRAAGRAGAERCRRRCCTRT